MSSQGSDYAPIPHNGSTLFSGSTDKKKSWLTNYYNNNQSVFRAGFLVSGMAGVFMTAAGGYNNLSSHHSTNLIVMGVGIFVIAAAATAALYDPKSEKFYPHQSSARWAIGAIALASAGAAALIARGYVTSHALSTSLLAIGITLMVTGIFGCGKKSVFANHEERTGVKANYERVGLGPDPNAYS